MLRLNMKYLVIIFLLFTVSGCESRKKEYASFAQYPIPAGDLTEMIYTPAETKFRIWAPTAEDVRVMLYKSGDEDNAFKTIVLQPGEEGLWGGSVAEDLKGVFYTFNVKVKGKWLGDTPGIMAEAVGVNGRRAAVINMEDTDPEGWENDVRPALGSDADVILYEMHHRDFSVDTASGIKNRGKYLALTEQGTKNTAGQSTGIDHLKELGITHVHLLPSFDFASVDESMPGSKQYNWGYDPQNYNVPEGSYSTDARKPEVRIREFKQMVQALHKAGIRVVMDVVYNHTYHAAASNFERTVPGYFYRQKPDGTLADASACGNETASERPVVRKFIIESVLHWVNEYHIDGFRFDLMGIHDIETMNEIRKAVNKVDPSVIIYGEGWAASQPQLGNDSLAMKINMARMPRIAAFSDELRDGLRGKWSDNTKGAFLAGIPGHEESIKFGIVGAVSHPQVKYDLVNYSPKPWADQPAQMISYVSCHDDMCLVDRLKATMPEGTGTEELIRLDKLAQTAVFTSQGIPFIYAGEEIMRNKKGVHNSFQSPDSINAIYWNDKTLYKDVFDYYKGLIELRRAHPAFRMGDAVQVRRHLEFLPVEGGNLIAYRLIDHAGGDNWEEIIVVLNSNPLPVGVDIPAGKYTVVCKDGIINPGGLGQLNGGEVSVPAQSALIIYR